MCLKSGNPNTSREVIMQPQIPCQLMVVAFPPSVIPQFKPPKSSLDYCTLERANSPGYHICLHLPYFVVQNMAAKFSFGNENKYTGRNFQPLVIFFVGFCFSNYCTICQFIYQLHLFCCAATLFYMYVNVLCYLQ